MHIFQLSLQDTVHVSAIVDSVVQFQVTKRAANEFVKQLPTERNYYGTKVKELGVKTRLVYM